MSFAKHLVVVLLSVCLFTAGSLNAAETTKAPSLDLKGTRILISAGYYAGMGGMPAVKRLTDAGAEVGYCMRPDLTWEELQKYHVVIIVFDQAHKVPKRSQDALQKFVESGGGVFFFWTMFELTDNVNQCLAPFGAKLLKEYIQDPQNTFVSPSGFFNLSYSYTKNIATNHPLTEGVKGLWYDVDTQSECLFGTSSIDVSKDWTTLVSGEPSAASFGLFGQIVQGQGITKDQQRPGKYMSSPPIVAARKYGSGAVVFTGFNAIEMFYGQGLPFYSDVAIEKGDGLRRSDFGRLYNNALQWLAQHGKKSDILGRDKLKPVVNGWADGGNNKFDWSDPNMLAGQLCSKPIKGVIGLHSTLSDGKDSPEVLIARAKASGLQWVAFTEKMEVLAEGPWERKTFKQDEAMASSGERSQTLSPAKWEQLRKICKEASTEDFAALPGLDYADDPGDRWVVFGDFEWPDANVFSPDKKKIIIPVWWFATGTVPNGPYDVGHNKLHPWDYQLYNMWPIRTTIAGKQIDQAISSYEHNQGVYAVGGRTDGAWVYGASLGSNVLYAMQQADGFITMMPTVVSVPGADLRSIPVVMPGKPARLAVGAAQGVCFVSLDAEGRPTDQSVNLPVVSPAVRGVAWSDKFKLLFVAVEKAP